MRTTSACGAGAGGGFYIASKANSADQVYINVNPTYESGTTNETNIGAVLEQAVFDDITLSLTAGLKLEGDSNNNNVYGSQYNDTIYGMDGFDTLYGNRGNDTLIGGTSGDNLYGGAGDDLLYGGSGSDYLVGEAGADTFVFEGLDTADAVADFSTTQGDRIDIANILSGYDPLSDAISDFVRITDNGSNSILSVDQDGGANNFVQIATLYGVTNIAAGATATETELQTLIANGMLIAA